MIERVQMFRVKIRGRVELLTRAELVGLQSELACALSTHATDPERIILAVCQHFGIERATLMSRSRVESIAWARQIAMALCRTRTRRSLEDIGKFFRRDHGTIHHAHEKFLARMGNDKQTKIDVDAIVALIEAEK